jgi:hypothetical protein
MIVRNRHNLGVFIINSIHGDVVILSKAKKMQSDGAMPGELKSSSKWLPSMT